MTLYNQYINEMMSSQEQRNLLDASRLIDIQKVLEKGGIESQAAGYGGREYLEFHYRGKRYEIIQVDHAEEV